MSHNSAPPHTRCAAVVPYSDVPPTAVIQMHPKGRLNLHTSAPQSADSTLGKQMFMNVLTDVFIGCVFNKKKL